MVDAREADCERLSLQDGKPAPLLPALAPEHTGRKCLVLDLDETLLHSSFKVSATAALLLVALADGEHA